MFFNQLTIRKKLTITIVLAVLASTSIIGLVSQRQAQTIIENRMVNNELPALLKQIRNRIDKEVTVLLQSAEQLANNVFVEERTLKSTKPNSETQLIEMLGRLKEQYGLADASVSNRKTANYWNQKGFLRQLNPDRDSWFFAFRDSGKETMVSVYSSTTEETKLFLNYQQVNGHTMSGVSKPMDEMIAFLDSFKIEESGFVFLSDGEGMIRLHRNKELVGKVSLAQEFGDATSSLFNKQGFSLVEVNHQGKQLFLGSSYIESMDWYLIAQVPKDEVFEELYQSRYYMIVTTLIVIGIFLLVAVWLAGTITRPIAKLADVFQDLGEGEGDLRQRLDADNKDEMAKLAMGFNSFIEKIHRSVSSVAETGDHLGEASRSVASQSQRTLENTQHQQDRVTQVATAINQMGSTVNEIANNASQAADAAQDAEKESDKGQQVVLKARDNIMHLAEEMQQVATVVASLAESSQSIGSILDVIRGISDQTNLLALNAAIEAARAGEQGRGFAVVADEVRSLAGRTAESTDEIQQMINNLQEQAARAVNAIEQSSGMSTQGAEEAGHAYSALQEISNRVTLISDMNIQVATATEEQSSVVSELNGNVEEINLSTQEATDTAAELSEASKSLKQLADKLAELVGSFKL
ncbi:MULTISPECIES: methyl-accepting chemotaxis protein [unclassified Agarivorans]|uniref:methyl-accepting chemotaxis protein n=1 Tax=unclassified Agarivorans TaxID=2636026 RepID=UPI0026E11A5E|nr:MULTISPECIES: methyl-accepting chemotaxis protein [unclassified Agarivorans]MDO6687836.1 methyl-accepting chemotaxis protein [Agarivorans sp. 3_MG-2023]MDO6717458.1 methyl-accepting chemotaxis protein [Agarivorans sp. 2_MG-2023]MDO6763182.1 methyl-accepting chemotaxis protein [Agarivorans sp. 1_MG-2023]